MKNALKFLGSIILCQLIGFVGSLFTAKSVSIWYTTINKPSFNPPNLVFAPVWIALFVLMGIALFLVWSSNNVRDKKKALIVFFIQSIFNILWSVAFFGFQSPLAALIVIVILWILILMNIVEFFKVNKAAGWLLVPYILWVSFAGVLNLAIVILN